MKKRPVSKNMLLFFSIGFVILFLFMLIISILLTVFLNSPDVFQGCLKKIIPFLQWLSNFDAINDPFSIFIEILTSIGGVFFGIRIGQWIDEKEEKEKLSELWRKTNIFLKRLQSNICNSNISIYELAEYKIYWDSLQRADSIAARYLQNDDHYVDISFAFSFLTFYNSSWNKYNSIDEWRANVSKIEENRIKNWIKSFEELIQYTEEKSIAK